ncbi:MAG: hypothetical protein Q8Q08_02655 [Candidatus Omnitrophota bacterium]|nr:hypothetical protein [Candidatus Omnitrophota bacterium]MDZ4243411.1 hypothetical protein [Candidatus Omnitrophota bacterium]
MMYSALRRTMEKVKLWNELRSPGGGSLREYWFDRAALDPKGRRPGLSGYMRLRNEADFVGQAIAAILPFLDELVIVYNNCSDETPAIAEGFRRSFPDKVKVYEYAPRVYHQSSAEYHDLPAESPNSFVNQSNYALSKTTCRWAVKIDGDQVVIPELFGRAVAHIRKNGLAKYVLFKGVNLWDHAGKVYVNGNYPLCGLGDIGFFPVSPATRYIFTHRYGVFAHRLKMEWAGVLFFHLKGMKRDRGTGNYELEKYPRSRYHKFVKDVYTAPRLLEWEEFKRAEPEAARLPFPESLGIKPLR